MPEVPRPASRDTIPTFLHGGSVVTVGTFDGVHRGHWQLLQATARTAEERQLRSVLVTFDPHPLYVVRPEVAPRLLTAPDEKIEILAESGLNYTVFLLFDAALAAYSPRRFVEEILVEKFRLSQLVIGYDHGFGRDRSGNVDTLRRIGRELGFEVAVLPPVPLGERPVSSTRIRHALERGDVSRAAAALGRPYAVQGTVVRGAGLGRSLGFPTANLQISYRPKLIPRDGVYAVWAVLRERTVPGVLHVGPRPTFSGLPASVELHLFDFDDDLYGRPVKVEFCARIRDVARFDGAAALIRAMRSDCEVARALFAGGGGACQRENNGLQ